ncbi:uncharacterized protein FOMMEDRAFT_83759 [Fomitiporia mediterranea MF3/22]|uniref:uncharacterized protein n=1 Tax=Fomitiporia mediterranea (strain MF3/22) TaxID=694068 RepID=UPI0004409B42|nr:uncharacterized protein FOMMEDRAFT_83759 [Fomitiporia mediterranea MF3/22]EJD03974.1 hypothetical protein FOMMEDRAFT_83759 [Fomitiporia mediterranea MF3/22]
MAWQKEFSLSKRSKGCHLITDEIINHIRPGLHDVKIGILYLFIQHTSCGITVNENFDPASKDMDMALDNIVPQDLNWQHLAEGSEASHTKTALVGTSVQIPITDGRLNLGTWQGIYLTEFRNLAHVRRVVATIL